MWWRSTILICLLSLTHCGYSLRYRLKDTFVNTKGIFVPLFVNNTSMTGAETTFTNALIRELSSRHEVVLSDREKGGLELRGTLVRIDANPTVSTELGFKGLQSYRRLPSEYGVSVTIDFALVDLSNERLLWRKELAGYRRVNAPLTRTFDYEAPSSVGLFTQSVVESMYSEIARNIMRDMYDEMIDWF